MRNANIYIRIPEETKEAIQRIAEQRKTTPSRLLIKIICDYAKKGEKNANHN